LARVSSLEPFELPITILASDIDFMGHVNNVTYVRWIQDAATAHWTAAATEDEQDNLVWVILRHEIDYKIAAVPEDRIIARTWVGGASRLRFARLTEILRERDRAVLAKARTLWCPIDRRTGKPTFVTPAIRAGFSTGPLTD
jgi:acyl-CoA thioester hydrolase